MTTAPVLDPGDLRPTEQDPATLQFQRLERVRSQLRARRRRRWILVATLVMIVAGAGIVGFSAVRRTSIARAAHFTPPARVPMPAPTPMSAVIPVPPPVPTMPTPAPTPVSAVITVPPPPPAVPAAPPVNGATRDVARPLPARSDSHRAPAPARDEARDADPTAAIDWLLNTSRIKGP